MVLELLADLQRVKLSILTVLSGVGPGPGARFDIGQEQEVYPLTWFLGFV